jgi:hypothetical protein
VHTCNVISGRLEMNRSTCIISHLLSLFALSLLSPLRPAYAFSLLSRLALAFCCGRILSTSWGITNQVSHLRKIKVVAEAPFISPLFQAHSDPSKGMVMNNGASLALGDWNMIRHNEVEILEVIKQRRRSSFTSILTHTCSPACSQQARVRSAHCPLV